MKLKKVLIILYYWPPSGGMAVQRWLKFSKYLPEFGWEPIIYAPENAAYTEIDHTLENDITPGMEIIKQPIFEPYRFYKGFVGLKKDDGIGVSMALKKKPSHFARLKNNLSIWVRGNLFIPDARVFWVRPSVRFLKKYLKTHPVQAVITTGTPHSIHLIGKKLKPYADVPWIADFRDLWTSIDYYTDLKLTRIADRLHHRLERNVLKSADHVITVGERWKEEFLHAGAQNVTIITNGYDPEDLPVEPRVPDSKFSLVHVGSIGKNRNASTLWKVLSDKAGNDEIFRRDLEIKLIGRVDFTVLESISSHGLASNLNHIEYMTHADAMISQQNAQILLLLINNSADAKGRLTGKIFEYLASKRPILMVGPEDGEAAKLLATTKSGYAAGFEDEAGLAELIDKLFLDFQKGNLKIEPNHPERFSRKELTGELAALLNKLVKDPV